MVKLALIILAILILSRFIPDSSSSSDTLKRNEAWRLEKLEKARIKNYIENIKPYVPK